jgi:DNA ligase (NAD+)
MFIISHYKYYCEKGENMSENNEFEKYKSLRGEIERLNIAYYDDDNPLVSDYEYDMKLRELKNIESWHPNFPDKYAEPSPTQKVGGNASSDFKKVPHTHQMQSLQDIFFENELLDFDKKVRKAKSKFFPEKEKTSPLYVVEPKIDGLSVAIRYKNGAFAQALTRGSGGFTGEDVTENCRTIKCLPEKLNENVTIEVRGEVYMPLEVFAELNAQNQQEVFAELKNQQEENPLLKTPRNAASGALRQKNPAVTAERQLSLLIFAAISGAEFAETDEQILTYLTKLGFPVIPFVTWDEIDLASLAEMGKQKLPYDFDGTVIKVNLLKLREKMGKTAKFPKWAAAYKYLPPEVETDLTSVEFEVGRSGIITPVAAFSPVELGGVTISRASLHNQSKIDELNLHIGDKIAVRRAGEVIPEVVRVTAFVSNAEPVKIPDECPKCGSKTIQKGAGVCCVNPDCPALILGNIVHFASRNAMNINGLGEAVAKQLVDNGLVKKVSDIYKLTLTDLTGLKHFDTKSAAKLIGEIDKSRKMPFAKLIYALGIEGIGDETAKKIADKYGSFNKISDVTEEELSELEGVGKKLAENVVSAFKNERFRKTADELSAYMKN